METRAVTLLLACIPSIFYFILFEPNLLCGAEIRKYSIRLPSPRQANSKHVNMEEPSRIHLRAKAAVAVLGGAMTVAAVPPVLSAVGFTSTGIAASSLAAKMMSLSAIANGGGVAAGSLVATLQSVGAAGLSMSSKFLVGSAGSALVTSVMCI